MLVGVLGFGEWGRALALHLLRSGHTVKAYSRRLPEDQESQIFVSNQIEDLRDSELLVLALPSKALPDTERLLKIISEGSCSIVSAIKGLHPETSETPLTRLSQIGLDKSRIAVISGPSFACDLVAGKPLSLVVASVNESLARELAKTLSNQTTRVYASKDTIGVELGGIMKNVIAIAAGVSDGLEFGASARAAVITRGLSEMLRIATACGAEAQTIFGLSGLGDLVMTSSDDRSRNRRVGLELGRGGKLSDILSKIGAVAEGAANAKLILEFAHDHKLEAPITEQIVELLSERSTPRDVAKILMSRPLKVED